MAFATINPYTGETVKTFPAATPDEIDAAIGRAHAAFLGWRDTSLEERAKVLKRAAELLRAHYGRTAAALEAFFGHENGGPAEAGPPH